MVGGSSRGNPGEAEAQNKSFPRPHTPTPQEKFRKYQKYQIAPTKSFLDTQTHTNPQERGGGGN